MLDHSDWITAACSRSGLLGRDMTLAAHSTQHLVLGFLRDEAAGLIHDGKGTALRSDDVLMMIARLEEAGSAPAT